MNSDLVIIVNADGSVDPRLTRYLSLSVSEDAFHNRALEIIKTWKFEPGTRKGVAVRNGIRLDIVTNERIDSLPSTLEWRYQPGEAVDTLRGTWVRAAADPPFSPAESDSLYLAFLRRLASTHVLTSGYDATYCLVMPNGDSLAHLRITEAARRLTSPVTRLIDFLDDRNVVRFADYGCERTAENFRIFLPRLIRTENGRTSFQVSGDHLPNYPPGFQGRSWSAWRGRCVGQLQREGSPTMLCDISPAGRSADFFAWYGGLTASRDEFISTSKGSGATPIKLRLFYMMRGAFQADTAEVSLAAIPQLNDFAIVDSLFECGNWSPYSQQDSSKLFIVKGNPAGDRLDVTAVNRLPIPAPRGRACSSSAKPRPGAFATFLFGGVGDQATQPITLCLNNCQRKYVIDAARHSLAKPAFRFRLSDMRADTRMGAQVDLRLQTNQAPKDFSAFVVFLRSGSPMGWAWSLHRTSSNTWDLMLNEGGGYPPDTEVLVYVFER